MHAAEDLCPCDLAGVLPLEEEGLGLGRGEAEDLQHRGMSSLSRGAGEGEEAHFAVPTNEKTAPAGVDFVTGERVNFDLLLSETER